MDRTPPADRQTQADSISAGSMRPPKPRRIVASLLATPLLATPLLALTLLAASVSAVAAATSTVAHSSATAKNLTAAQRTSAVKTKPDKAGSQAALDTILREYPGLHGRVWVSVVPDASGSESYTYACRNGRLSVIGTSPVAACRGAYLYLRDYANGLFTWDTKINALPKVLPAASRTFGSTPFAYRHYFNVCTFGYSTVWWDWSRWQKEIDWMAFHGINMPLAMNGQERVWQDVFGKAWHIPATSLKKYFSGPAFLPWFRMGNEYGWMGPLTQHWLDGQADLQKKILDHERLMGMKPVVPGFSGFVPLDFAKYNPQARVTKSTGWAGFPPTAFLDVRDPRFAKIGTQFIKAYEARYGKVKYFLCDTFNEMTPPFPDATKLADIASSAKSIYQGIKNADPDGVWVMQGWLFYNESSYWKEPEVSALLGQVPKGKMIVLDLSDERVQLWKLHPAFRNTDWIYCTLHNFGQNTSIYGPLAHDLDTAKAARAAEDHGRMMGMGLTMEGIAQNPVLYELMCDEMWTPEPVTLESWVDKYAKSRYGALPPAAKDAWSILLKTVYNEDDGFRGGWRLRPGIGQITARHPQTELLEQALRDLLSERGTLGKSDGYQRDVVDIAKTWLGEILDQRLGETKTALEKKDTAKAAGLIAQDKVLFSEMNSLLATRPEYRLSTWVGDARKMGNSLAEKNWLVQNAKMQITYWGGPVLYDYANKEWSGIVTGYEEPRWMMYFKDLPLGKTPDYAKFEQDFAMNPNPVAEPVPGKSLAEAVKLLKKYGN